MLGVGALVGHLGGLGVVLGRWGGGGPWFGGLVGCPWWSLVRVVVSVVAVFLRPRGPGPPRCGRGGVLCSW